MYSVFHVGTLFVLCLSTVESGWTADSPVLTFQHMGITLPPAFNFVELTAPLSAITVMYL